MRKVRIVIMGKTGVGKSTIINAVLGEYAAETGDGAAITQENKVYKCKRLIETSSSEDGKYSRVNHEISLYDTVGLEVSKSITNQTLQKIKTHIQEAKNNSNIEDVNIVWFCINERTNRLEEYEVNLIKKLSIEYEIPFAIVQTQCISKKESSLTQDIKNRLPGVPVKRIMAQDYPMDEITIPAFGLDELLYSSIKDYYKYKIHVIESKIDELTTKSENEILRIENKGKVCISKCSEEVKKIGWLPVGCIPFVHGKCIKMISELNEIGGLASSSSFADEVFSDVVVGVVMTPFMAVPLLSSFAAQAYIETLGESYLKAIVSVVKNSTENELKDTNIIKQRLKEQLEKNSK